MEFMINSTRLNFGFDLRKFTERTGLPIRQDILMALGIAEAEGYIKWNGSYVLPTRKGQKFSNDLIRIFM